MEHKENMQIFLILGWKCENLWIFFDVQELSKTWSLEYLSGQVTSRGHLSRAYYP